ncbi:macrolide-inactivating glycosyltransferase [Streptomyces spiroverticillatus]|uniref:Macrolide-inactivating glycosyltransferase n=1 Tax=Streptomyces finlayi TaxID=67296 RepID=A0A918X640_9ACTN|nr:glycosyltransferase [Streptomyces finlayi]GHA30196.1 macrolide-inactivating glycosyltransferase [Streptomyces spiroverticillatus]GHD15026.1 macrolide-inactivating glycosyltransferase [Streptomyces finlayi]
MLHIALTAEPVPSHVSALDYVIGPALRQGHRTVLHGPVMFRGAALRRGLEFQRAGTDWTCDPVVQRTASETWTRHGNDQFNRHVFGRLWPERAATKTRHLLAAWTRARPDLVVAECSDLGAHVAARALGLPLVAADNGLGPLLLDLWDTDVAPALTPLHERYGQLGAPALPPLLTPAPVPWFYATPPPGIRAVRRTLAAHRTGSASEDRTARETDAAVHEGRAGAARPLVYVSLGTLTTAMPGLRTVVEGLYGEILAALAAVDCDVIVSAGPLAGRLQRAHPGVRIVEHVVQPALLRRADLFVTHGGRASLLDAVQGSTPVLVLGLLADQPDNAAAFAGLGLGRALSRAATREAITEAVRYLLGTSRYRAAAASASSELSRLPPLDLAELHDSAQRFGPARASSVRPSSDAARGACTFPCRK